jgi:hypothetical protein
VLRLLRRRRKDAASLDPTSRVTLVRGLHTVRWGNCRKDFAVNRRCLDCQKAAFSATDHIEGNTHAIRKRFGVTVGSFLSQGPTPNSINCTLSPQRPEARAGSMYAGEGPGRLTVWSLQTQGRRLQMLASDPLDQNPPLKRQGLRPPPRTSHLRSAGRINSGLAFQRSKLRDRNSAGISPPRRCSLYSALRVTERVAGCRGGSGCGGSTQAHKIGAVSVQRVMGHGSVPC